MPIGTVCLLASALSGSFVQAVELPVIPLEERHESLSLVAESADLEYVPRSLKVYDAPVTDDIAFTVDVPDSIFQGEPLKQGSIFEFAKDQITFNHFGLYAVTYEARVKGEFLPTTYRVTKLFFAYRLDRDLPSPEGIGMFVYGAARHWSVPDLEKGTQARINWISKSPDALATAGALAKVYEGLSSELSAGKLEASALASERAKRVAQVLANARDSSNWKAFVSYLERRLAQRGFWKLSSAADISTLDGLALGFSHVSGVHLLLPKTR